MATIQQSQPGMEPLLKSMSIANAKGCDAKTLALIAAQFIARGDDELEALRKANALYLKASAYTREFASLKLNQKEIEAFPEEALPELGEREDLAIGDSEANSPALAHFRATAKTKLDRHMPHKRFVEILKLYFPQRVESIGPSMEKIEKIEPPIRLSPGRVEHLHILVRNSRSRRRAERRKKPRKKNRTKRGV